VKYFLDEIFKNPKVAFIHVSQDEDLEDALKWAESAQFPWLTVTSKNSKAAGLEAYEAGTPSYALVSKMEMVKKLTKK